MVIYTKTPRSRIKGQLRRIFLQSRERNAALKRDGYKCQKCGNKKSEAEGHKVKVHVHHKNGIDVWDEIIDLIYQKILCSPDDLQTLCVPCHKEITKLESSKRI